ncbi:MAG TPA: methyltransferase domain-containing protein [Solirubrobacteraceae bacterium]|nr:methyltransferase domain-containing protein [Solirubrobacteraceae bacterium]
MTATKERASKPVDWSLGHYEHTAAQLLPAARVLVERASPTAGEYVVDIGCGTGNAALLAAEHGARVIGVDPAPRLLAVARAAADERRLEATFELGDAADLPVPDGQIDLAISAFGLIFAPDPRAAAAELARVSAPASRIVLSAWLPGGPLAEVARVGAEALARAVGAPAGPTPFPWHERDALQGLLGPHGFTVRVDEHRLAFTGRSPREFLDADSANHPMAVSARAVLEPLGTAAAVYQHMLEIYEAANEDPDAFRVTSRYVVATARRERG